MSAIGNILTSFGTRLGSTLLPDPYLDGTDLTPEQRQAAQTAALRQFGLAMLANIGSGRGFGPGLGQAFQLSSGNGTEAIQRAVQNARANRMDQRQVAQDATANDHWTQSFGLQQQQLAAEKARADAEAAYRQQALGQTGAYQQGELDIGRKNASANAAQAQLELQKAAQAAKAAAAADAIVQKAQSEGRDLTMAEKSYIQALRGSSFGTIDPLMMMLMGGGGLGFPGGVPGAPAGQGPTSADVMNAYRR